MFASAPRADMLKVGINVGKVPGTNKAEAQGK